MASDRAVAFRYVCPSDVVSESDKDTQGALIRAFDKYDLIALVKHRADRFHVNHFVYLSLHGRARYGRNVALLTRRAFSRMAALAPCSAAARAASRWGASRSSRRFASTLAV